MTSLLRGTVIWSADNCRACGLTRGNARLHLPVIVENSYTSKLCGLYEQMGLALERYAGARQTLERRPANVAARQRRARGCCGASWRRRAPRAGASPAAAPSQAALPVRRRRRLPRMRRPCPRSRAPGDPPRPLGLVKRRLGLDRAPMSHSTVACRSARRRSRWRREPRRHLVVPGYLLVCRKCPLLIEAGNVSNFAWGYCSQICSFVRVQQLESFQLDLGHNCSLPELPY